MDFVAIDVETANADMSSICQIGIARYAGGELVDTWKTLVDPQDYFDAMNVSVHGISAEDVAGAPTFLEITDRLSEELKEQIVVCHTHFDRVSVRRAYDKLGRDAPDCSWLDSARVARRAWADKFAKRGYGLANVCIHLNYSFGHHDALEDAKAAGHIMLCAAKETGFPVSEWMKKVCSPIQADSGKITREGNPDGDLSGEVLVFTGALQMPRREAADMAARAGCSVASGVNRKTTLLVVGDQDIRVLTGEEKSSKHRKAEELITKGQNIRIVGESDFAEMVKR